MEMAAPYMESRYPLQGVHGAPLQYPQRRDVQILAVRSPRYTEGQHGEMSRRDVPAIGDTRAGETEADGLNADLEFERTVRTQIDLICMQAHHG
jgi:hypothetical protein